VRKEEGFLEYVISLLISVPFCQFLQDVSRSAGFDEEYEIFLWETFLPFNFHHPYFSDRED
jgi:hypothetical protein